MSTRYVVLAIGQVRAPWFTALSRWAADGALPVEVLRCRSGSEARARLATGRAISALITGHDARGVDRDLVGEVRDAGAAVLVVGGTDGALASLADATLPTDLTPDGLLTALRAHAPGVATVVALPEPAEPLDAGEPGRLWALTGVSPLEVAPTAMALAAALAHDRAGLADRAVLLCDAALRADLAMLHDAEDVVPGIQELIEACRFGRPDVEELARHARWGSDHAYALLPGLRRHRDWAALRPRAVQVALDLLIEAHDTVLAVIDPDVEGEPEVGSPEVEERNALARAAATRAELVAVVATANLHGVHHLVHLLDGLNACAVGPRLVPVVLDAPRAPWARADLTDVLARATAHLRGGPAAPPVFWSLAPPRRRHQRDGRGPGPAPATPLRHALDALAGDLGARRPVEPAAVAVVPGSLGSWVDEETGS